MDKINLKREQKAACECSLLMIFDMQFETFVSVFSVLAFVMAVPMSIFAELG